MGHSLEIQSHQKVVSLFEFYECEYKVDEGLVNVHMSTRMLTFLFWMDGLFLHELHI